MKNKLILLVLFMIISLTSYSQDIVNTSWVIDEPVEYNLTKVEELYKRYRGIEDTTQNKTIQIASMIFINEVIPSIKIDFKSSNELEINLINFIWTSTYHGRWEQLVNGDVIVYLKVFDDESTVKFNLYYDKETDKFEVASKDFRYFKYRQCIYQDFKIKKISF